MRYFEMYANEVWKKIHAEEEVKIKPKIKKLSEKKLQILANSIARKAHYGRATEVVFGNVKEPKIIECICYGYRKYTTGEYVCKSYLDNFGWKNTYYQHSIVKVLLPLSLIDWEES